MSAWAKPGVKCVWVDVTKDPAFLCHSPRPVAGTVVTVTRVLHEAHGTTLVIEGWPNPYSQWNRKEQGWRIHRFRPLITRTQEQDVAKFRHLLTPSPVDVGLVPAGVEFGE